MPEGRDASSAIRETILTIAEPRKRTAHGAMLGFHPSPGTIAVGDIDMKSAMSEGEWTRDGWWPKKWYHILSGGMLQKEN